MKNCALVLAGGCSKRFGEDKRLYSNPPLIVQTLQTVVPMFDEVFLVHRTEDELFLKSIKSFDVHCIPAPKEALSLGTSISVGIKKIQVLNYFDTCAIFLADMPFIKKESITRLLEVSAIDKIIRPQFQASLGHPVIFGKKFFKDLTDLKGKDGASSVVKKNLFALKVIVMNDEGTVIDIDYPQDIQKREIS